MKNKIFIALIAIITYSTIILAETRIEFDIKRGKYWFHDIKIAFIKKEATPQMVIWTEDMNGNVLRTIYASKHTYKWRKNNVKNRIYSLPVWWHKVDEKMYPINDADGIAGATINSNNEIYSFIDSKSQIKVFIELNNSFDYNDFFTKKGKNNTVKAPINGQPSVVYSATIDPTKDTKVTAKLIGYGSVDGQNGKIETKFLNKFTTAKELVNDIIIEIK